MSEEVQETESTSTDEIEIVVNDNTSGSLDSVEDPKVLKKMIRELRTENAGHRKKKGEQEGQLEEYKKWKTSQQTELEKAQEREKTLLEEKRALLADKLALEYGVDDEFKDFIAGESEDEMRKRAEKLGSKGSDNSDNPLKARLLGGNRGNAVGKTDTTKKPAGSSEANWFKSMYDSSS